MTPAFDPYRDWLGLEIGVSPPSHYQLLGLAEFEADAAVIAAAADVRMKEVRQYQTGPRGRFTQKILNELSAAKLCLLEARTKQIYDAQLHALRMPVARTAPRMAASLASYLVEPPVAPPLHGMPPAAPPPIAPPPVAPRVAASSALASASHPHSSSANDEGEESQPSLPWGGIVLVIALIALTSFAAGIVFWRMPRGNVVEVPQHEVPPPAIAKPSRRDQPLPDEVVITQEGTGDISFPMASAELSGLERNEQGGKTLLTGFGAPEATARWRFKVVRPAIFKVQLIYKAMAVDSAQWDLTLQNGNKTRAVENGTSTDEFFWKVTSAGEQTLDLKVLGLPENATLELQSVRFLWQDAGRVK